MSGDFIRFRPSEIAVVPPRVKLFRIIPVAKIMYGYGAGAGTGGRGDSSIRGEGGGGGGGVRAVPVGVIEVSNQQTRFVPITDRKKLTGALLAGIGFGMWLGWRRRR
jgi:uncharacterized spore protein YtfJ